MAARHGRRRHRRPRRRLRPPGREVDGNDVVAVRDAAAAGRRAARAAATARPCSRRAPTATRATRVSTPASATARADEVEAWLARDPLPRRARALLRGSRRADRAGDEAEIERVVEDARVRSVARRRARAPAPHRPGSPRDRARATARRSRTRSPRARARPARGRARRGRRCSAASVNARRASPSASARPGPRHADLRAGASPAPPSAPRCAGLRPVVEIMFGDFLWLVMDTLVNQASKYWYLSNGQASVPLTIRTAVGARRPVRRLPLADADGSRCWASPG